MLGILLVIVVSCIFLNYLKNKRIYEAGDKFPGPRALPLLGNSLDFASSSNGIFEKFTEFSKKYERFFRIWNNGRLYVICYEHKDAEVLLSNTFALGKTDVYRYMKPWIGEGLISTSDLELWRRHRKIITPTFHFKILHDFTDIFNKNARTLCEKLKAKAGGEPFDVSHFVKLAFLDNICETAMGVNVNAQMNSESEYVKAVKGVSNIISLRFFKVWLMLDFLFNLSKYSRMQRAYLKVLHGATNSVIHERRENLNRHEPAENAYGKRKLAFLDLLLQSEEGSKLSDRELREEVDTFMFAGHDTISSAVSFALYSLAEYPEVQENVYKEQLKIFGDSDRPPTYADVQEMKYLERVSKEVLRLYPSAPIIGREICEDLTLPGGHLVPKGSQLVINIFALHRDPKVWPEPEKFNPDNFLPEAMQSRNPYSYVPFSAGPRNCLGQKYAMLAMKTAISWIVRRYKFLPSHHPEHKLKLAAEIVLLSTNGYHLRIEERE